MQTITCTNRTCLGQMIDRGNYFYCPTCHSLEFKLDDQDRPWEPLPRQQTFLYAPNPYTWYVGGVGSGKTMVGSYKAILKGMEHPGGMGLVGAQVYPQLRDATMNTFFQVCPEKLMWKGSKEKAFSKTDAILTLSNEHQILFRPLDDASKLQSLNLVWFWIDEAAEVGEDIFFMLQSRLRSRQGFIDGIPRHQGWVTSNPNGHDYLYMTFVVIQDPDYMYVNAPTRENKYLPPGYEERLRRRWPEAWVKRYLDGSFDVFEGQIYPMLDVLVHGAFPSADLDDYPHAVPSGWPVFVSLDHGVTNPTAVGFYTVGPDETVYKFDEHYEANQPVSYHAQKIKEKLWSWGVDPQNVQDWLIDPSTKGQRGMEGRAVMAEYMDQGLPFRPANNQVQAGILQVVEYLMPNSVTGGPKFFIHRRCKHTWHDMSNYKWKAKTATSNVNEPEEPVKKDDHAADETRYFLMTRPKIDMLKAADPIRLWQQQMLSKYGLDDRKLPIPFRTHSNWNKGPTWPNSY